jgi:hypothetical protein
MIDWNRLEIALCFGALAARLTVAAIRFFARRGADPEAAEQ